MIEYKAQKLLLAALTVAIFMSCAFVCKKVYLAPPQVIKMPDQNHALISRTGHPKPGYQPGGATLGNLVCRESAKRRSQ